MNVKQIVYIKEILIEQMNHWMMFPLVLTAMDISRESAGIHISDFLIWELFSMIPLFMFIIRCKVKRFFIFTLWHFGITGAILWLNQIYPSFYGVICVCAILVYAVLSFLMQMKSRLYSIPLQIPVGVGVSVVAILLQHYQGTNHWDFYYALVLIGTIALYFIILYLEHYLDFLSVNQSSAGYLPASEMLRSGFGLTLGYTLLGAVILAVSTNFTWLSDIFYYIKEFLLWILRYLFSKLPKGNQEEQEVIEQMGNMSLEGLLSEEEPFWLWKILWQVVGFLVLALLVIITARLLIKVFRWLLTYFASHKTRDELPEEDVFDIRERCSMEKSTGRKKQNIFDAFSYRERIRKLYKRRLLSASPQMPERERKRMQYDTAREWEEKLKTEGMAALYEQARYSDHEVTGADVRKMREACK